MPWGVANYNVNPALNVSINGIDIAELFLPPLVQRRAAADHGRHRQRGLPTPSLIRSPLPTAARADDAAAALAAFGGLGAAYQRLPQVAKSAAFAFDLTMDGGHVRYTGAAAAATINPNATTAFPRDAVIVIVNDGSGALTITRGAAVALIWAATGADANRALAAGGMATILQVATDRWFISGAGLS
jgi:hypothetical protein